MNPHLDLDRRLVGDIYTSHAAMRNLEILCDDCGARFVGTEEEARAAAHLEETLRRYGCETRRESYEYQGWTRGEASFELLRDGARAIDCISLPYCPPSDLSAQLASAGCGTPEEFDAAGDALRGRVVMAHSRSPAGYPRWIHRKEKYDRAILAGAAAFVFVSEQPGLGPETGSLMDDAEGPIPGISIRYEDGAYLDRMARRHGPLDVHLRTTDSFQTRESWNIVGELPGTDLPDEVILLGSHYDGHDIAQGAIDPASGTIVVLEVARVLAAHARRTLRRTVRFVCWGTEEIGLIGARRHVERHRGDLDAIRFVLNLDSAGGSRGTKGLLICHQPALTDFFAAGEAEMATAFPTRQHIHAHSDHWPYFLEGVPCGWMGDPDGEPRGRGWGHTRFDTYEKVEEAGVRDAAANAARATLRMATAENFPSRRLSPDEVASIFETDPGLEDQRVAKALLKRA